MTMKRELLPAVPAFSDLFSVDLAESIIYVFHNYHSIRYITAVPALQPYFPLAAQPLYGWEDISYFRNCKI